MSDPEQTTGDHQDDSSMPDAEPLAIDADDLNDFIDRYEDQKSEEAKADDGPDVRSILQPPL